MRPSLLGQSGSTLPISVSKKIHANLIVAKLKSSNTSNGRTGNEKEQLKILKDIIDYDEHIQVFKKSLLTNARISSSNLHHIYKIKLKPGSNIWQELAKINALDFIEYAEPFFQNELLFIPNDPQADPDDGQQGYLTVIRAYEGWQIDRSDSSMVIGIVDTGVNMNHEDLGNLAFNDNDPVNGIDDDGDGYIDNFQGWDMSDNDNDPTADGHPHGTNVVGMSSATANNGIGMAGIGFNSKYLPVKISETSSKKLLNEYEGIIYAGDQGCDVINLSWGGAGNYSKYGQDIINYAVMERDVVVVAAAGNTPEELDFYPASYDNVLSVGATDIDDNKASWATFSHFIDIMAPGDNVYTTKNNGGYEITTGSSFAAPLVAGAAALVRSHFPGFSAQQVMEQLRVTSDNIYQIGSNMNYYGQLGSGRLNVQRALSEIVTPAIRVSDLMYETNHQDLIFPGDTVSFSLRFTNYLRTATNVTVSIANPSDNVSWEIDQVYIDRLGEFESYENSEHPFCFVVNPDVQPGDRLLFRLDFVGNNYADFQYIEIFTTPEYFDISDGNLVTTISSDGDIGFDESHFMHGNGIAFGEELVASQAGFIISLDSNHVLDNVINNYGNYAKDQDFERESIVRLYDNSIADFDARSVFKPSDTIPSALDIKVEQKILSWKNQTNDGFIIFEYRIINTGDSTLTHLNTGLFADWDLGQYQSNIADWDSVNQLGYVVDMSSNNLYSGISLLTSQHPTFYSIDKENMNGNQADIDTIFNDLVKHEFLSAESPKAVAGSPGVGNDVAQLVGAKDIHLEANQSVKIAFAMLASTSLDGLKSALDQARSKYADYLNDPPLAETFYACLGDSVTIDPLGELYKFYNDVNLTQQIDSGFWFKTDPILTDQIYYAVNLDSGYSSDVMKIVATSGTPQASFEIPSDTLLLESGTSQTLLFQNLSALSDQWLWDFGNGYGSTIKSPQTTYESPGTYQVELVASNTHGCADTTAREVLVATRPNKAVVEDQQICKGTSAELMASNTNNITVYSDLEHKIFSGEKFTTGAITSDTLFYVTNSAGDFESEVSEVQIQVIHPEMGIDYQLDTLNLDAKYLVKIFDQLKETANSVSWFIDEGFISNNSSFTYAYSDEPFTVTQIKADEENCRDTLQMVIEPEYSKIPYLQNVVLCKNSDFTIRPENGNLFYFYKDMELKDLVHKGTSLAVNNISDGVEFFVTGIDGLLESASNSIKIKTDPVKAIIESSADTVDIQNEKQLELSNQSINASRSYWLWDTGTFDTVSVIQQTYKIPGTYEYIVVAEGYSGCLDTTQHQVRAINVTGMELETFSRLKIYPNPVSDLLTVDLGEPSDIPIEFELIDLSGKTLMTFTIGTEMRSCQLRFDGLQKGVYLLKSRTRERPVIARILKR